MAAHWGLRAGKGWQGRARSIYCASLQPDGEYREYCIYWEEFDSPNSVMLIGYGTADEAS